MKNIIVFAALVAVSGCSFLQPISGQIAKGVVRYCQEPESARAVVRDSINVELASAGHILHVHCKGDAPLPPE